ncbi:glycosyltransferase family 2 protein [Phormidium sp. FACHB-592]|uniref:Glycosyltransferase family 2 protein n=1 Tax=Stenomitos frigidus AS-A4 TaxID=2933935 RepID=A0ABV0KT90_9CYAN|nr:glycosyltransferase family 2 protein [Phormidium sp. FACHB-592]MBD2074228.1 glycosyltransferase family 2 protein [Phormidium sp. FACHB-592]
MARLYTVAAYITAYDDAIALNACVTALRFQSYCIQHILIVDNSSQALRLSEENQADDRLLVWHYPKNIGIAGGLALAIQWARQRQYNFLWTFDQDSTPASDCLEHLLAAYVKLATEAYVIGMIAPTAIDARTGQTVKPSLFLGDRFRGFVPVNPTLPYECDAPITSGALVSLRTVAHVEPPDAGLFIDGIDLDYGLRLRQAGFHNLVVPDAAMYHRFGVPFQLEILGRKKVFQLYSPLRYYYICRNHTYLELRHSQGWYRLTCCLRRLKFLLLTVLKILAFDAAPKGQKAIACVTGTYHGFLGRLGKTW